VPCIVISPYARRGYVDHTQYEFGSILKFVEGNWKLASLGATDVRATSIIDAFDFAQAPRKYVPVQAKLSQSFFEHQAPSYRPPDDD
jgi:phospholipase C